MPCALGSALWCACVLWLGDRVLLLVAPEQLADAALEQVCELPGVLEAHAAVFIMVYSFQNQRDSC